MGLEGALGVLGPPTEVSARLETSHERAQHDEDKVSDLRPFQLALHEGQESIQMCFKSPQVLS